MIPHKLSPEDIQARLQAWRREGLWRADPVRFARLESLLRRIPTQGEAVRQRLLQRMQVLLADYAERVAGAQCAVAEEGAVLLAVQPAMARALRPLQATGDLRGLRRLAARSALRSADTLQALNAHLQQVSPTVRQAQAAELAAGREELSGVRAFRRLWGLGRSVDRLAQARARQPAHAGPLNSHVLVLQSLDLMQQLSPDYLRHFLVHVEALQWLEQWHDAPPPAGTAASGPTRAMKSAKSARRAPKSAP